MAQELISAAAAGSLLIGDDRKVNRLGFGAMRITGDGIWGPPRDHANALAVLRLAVELGVTLIDTADAYGPNISEELIAQALYPYPTDLTIATKGGYVRTGPNAWTPSGDPQHLHAALNGSLKRLRVERIDLYQLHRPDPNVPFEESVRAIAEMQRAGKIRHIGLSNVSVAHIEKARQIAPIVSVQNRFNTMTRGAASYNGVTDDETLAVVDYCTHHGIAFFPWGPLAAGKIASDRIDRLARKRAVSAHGIALAWLLKRSPVIVPIPGTASLAHLEENMSSGALTLTDDEFVELTA